ncbi:hypothetical protein PVAND_001731 [Polypedilum vanderplanki]|uniref:Homeobox domain-containing protein n=1 Tax=Polypedilum vanderplanki TaxID=319348 RepID=A0A9J6BP35_POLVA|nr:hypothetical protein PVAND_001731 [Polypedilum vanderplanki]
MNLEIIPSESGSDRSSSVASGDCCSPDIGRSSENSTRSQNHHQQQQQQGSSNSGNKSPNGTNFDEATDGENSHLNLFAMKPQPKKKRKSRTAFTNHQIFELEKRFLYQKYLSPADRDEIAAALGLSNAQVITWFQNRRAKLKRDIEELKKDVESVKALAGQQENFLKNVTDLNLLKKKPIPAHDGVDLSPEK